MPEFPIIDTHLHIWDPAFIDYPWLETVPLLNKPYLIEDYQRAAAPLNVEAMVFLQCEADFSQAQKEAVWVSEVAKTEPRIQGIVPCAPLELGEGCRPDLERLVSSPMVKGIRRIIQFENDPEFCLRPGFVRGVQLLAQFGLSFDICIAHYQMRSTIEMVRRCPEVNFILDHIGKPDIRQQALEPWKSNLKELSDLPNVHCKVSGLVVEADMSRWTVADLQPYFDHVIDCFGFERVMFGGDWPVVLQAAELAVWVDSLDQMLRGCSPDERKKLYSTNARQFYRLS